MSAPTQREVTLSGLRHRVLVWGADRPGPATLLFHGFLDLADSFGPMAASLLQRGAGPLISVDFRGHGHSEWIGAGGYYHFPDYVRDAIALVEATPELTHDFVVVGHSMGGTVATYVASVLGPRVRGLALLEGSGPTGYQAEHAPKRIKMWLDGLGRVERWRARRFADLAEVTERLRAAFPELSDDVLVDFARRSTVADGEGLRWRYDPLHRTRSPVPFSAAVYQAFAATVEVPTLLVTGAKSTFAKEDPDRTRREAALRGPLTRATVEGAGHMMHLSHPDPTAGLIAEWVAGLDPAAPA